MLDKIELTANTLYHLADLALDHTADDDREKLAAILTCMQDKATQLYDTVQDLIRKGGLPDAVHS